MMRNSRWILLVLGVAIMQFPAALSVLADPPLKSIQEKIDQTWTTVRKDHGKVFADQAEFTQERDRVVKAITSIRDELKKLPEGKESQELSIELNTCVQFAHDAEVKIKRSVPLIKKKETLLNADQTLDLLDFDLPLANLRAMVARDFSDFVNIKIEAELGHVTNPFNARVALRKIYEHFSGPASIDYLLSNERITTRDQARVAEALYAHGYWAQNYDMLAHIDLLTSRSSVNQALDNIAQGINFPIQRALKSTNSPSCITLTLEELALQGRLLRSRPPQ